MKTLRLLLIQGMTLMMLFTGCEKSEVNESVLEDESQLNTTPEMDEASAALEAEMLEPGLSEPTEQADIETSNDGIPELLRETEDIPEDSVKGRPCLRDLNLTAGQLDSLKEAHFAFRHCIGFWVEKLKEINRRIISEANQKRADLVAKFKNGEITEEELKAELKELYFKTKLALKNNQGKEEIIRHIILCHKKLMIAVHSILTPEQFKAWLRCIRRK